MVKLYEELTISDDFMFGNAMGDKVVSRSGWICIRGIKSECTMQSCRTRESAGESGKVGGDLSRRIDEVGD